MIADRQDYNRIWLKVLQGDTAGERYFAITKKNIFIGRLVNNDIVITDPTISKKHAKISLIKNEYFIEDLSSSNGTNVNGSFLAKGSACKLKNKDTIKLGKVVLQVLTRKPIDFSVSRKKYIIVSSVISILLLSFIFLLTNHCVSNKIGTNNQTFDYGDSISLPAPSVYECGLHRDNNCDKLSFTFEGISGRSRLYFTAKGIPDDDSIGVFVNGSKFGNVDSVLQGWGDQKYLNIPRQYVLGGKTNTLMFKEKNNGDFNWGLKDIYVENILDKECNQSAADRLISLGDEMLEEENVNKGNLFLSVNYYSEALSYIGSCNEDGSNYKLVNDKHAESEKKLQEMYNNLLFLYYKDQRFNNGKDGKKYLEEILLLVPSETDKRVIFVKQLLEK